MTDLSTQDIGLISGYDKQAYVQFNPQDLANWYLTYSKTGKREFALYPSPGRRHIEFLDQNKLVFPVEPREIFQGVNYAYAIVGSLIYRIDEFYNTIAISGNNVTTVNGNMYFARLVNGNTVYACFADGQNIYVYNELTNAFDVITDADAPDNPLFLASFGSRLLVSNADTNEVYFSDIGLGGAPFNPASCFTAGNFITTSDIVQQLGVLHNLLYVYLDFTTEIWANIPTRLPNGTLAPFKKNTGQQWDYGIADPKTLDIDFGMMTFLAKNKNGAVQVMTSNGGYPKDLNSKAIDLLFRRDALNDNQSPFLRMLSNGFLYQEDDTIFYRISSSSFEDFQNVDIDTSSHAIEYNFETNLWHRVIEYNGQRNRIQKHIFFPDRHLVTLLGEGTIYEMSTQFSTNEELVGTEYVAYPMRYETIGPILSSPDYAEFKTQYAQIDMVFGDSFPKLDAPFSNTTFIVAEQSPQYVVTEDSGSDDPTFITTEDGDYIIAENLINTDNTPFIVTEDSTENNETFLITEDSDIPVLDEIFYRQLYKPYMELFFSDDGGETYNSADVKEFSPQGILKWRMRWYQLGNWRNRNYKFIVVNPKHTVILGAIHAYRRISGGAN